MIFKKLNQNIRKYILACLSLLIVFFLISLYEIIVTLLNGLEVGSFFQLITFKFLNHFLATVLIALLFFPIYYLIAIKKPKTVIVVTKILFCLLIVIELSLTEYSLTTLLNLGADLLGYSLDDIYMTVTTSSETSIISYFPYIILPAIFWINCYFLKKSQYLKYAEVSLIASVFLVLGLQFSFDDFSKDNYQNKTYFFTADVLKFQLEKREISKADFSTIEEFPLLKSSEKTPDVLGTFFETKPEKPNIVLILMEGLGSEFVGDREFSDFSPYLNSLIPQSLFWENFLSNTGRTFGGLPSFTASLPFGEKGFLEVEDTPTHLSLFSILKKNGYATAFFSGDQTSFDKKINYLEYNAVETIVDKHQFSGDFVQADKDENGFSWGYQDYAIFKKTLQDIQDIPQPRLDLITTQTVHEPFIFPEKEQYLQKIDSMLETNKNLKVSRKKVLAYKDIFASVLYADASLKMFMENYKKRSDYENTIFVISGDHRLIPIEQKDKLCRFNVPLYIFSPMLKTSKRMKSISSHFDVTPTLLSFLASNYDVSIPKETAWVGKGIDTSSAFRNVHEIPLMRYKGSINDYVYEDYFLSDGTLFKINQDFNMERISNPKMKSKLTSKLREFKQLNAYVVSNNKIYPENDEVASIPRIQFSEQEKTALEKLTDNLSVDELFFKAREKAFAGKRDTAVLISNYILKKSPNYVDVRILKGRALAWDAKYEESEIALRNAMKRSPFYDDVYLAMLDMFWWSSQNEKAIEIYQKAKEKKIINDEIAFKMARAYKSMLENEKATQILDSILARNPSNEKYLQLKNSL